MSVESSILSKDTECMHMQVIVNGSSNLKCKLCENILFPSFLKEFHQLQNNNHSLSEKNHYLNNKVSQLKEANALVSQQLKDVTFKYEQLQGLEASRHIEHELQIQDMSSELSNLKSELLKEQDKSLFYLEEKNAINTELSELSRALFEEANGMVAEENKKNFYLEQDVRMQKTKISLLQDELFNEKLQLQELKSKIYNIKDVSKSTIKWIDKMDNKVIDNFEVFTCDLKDTADADNLSQLINLVNTHSFMQPIIQEIQLMLKNKIVTGILVENVLRDSYKLDYFPVDPNAPRVMEKPKSPSKPSRPSKCIICDNDLYFHPFYTLQVQSTSMLSKTTLSYHLCMYCKDKVISICDLIIFIKHVSQNLYKKRSNLLYVDLIKHLIDMTATKISCHKLALLLTEAIDNNQQIDASASSLDITMGAKNDTKMDSDDKSKS
eukprot:NODE_591_length_6340_cov_0.231533.p1 type:complete len:437 gc:universal NODE_591_length_6340_cov_0.231533:5292-3982(-)